MPQPPGRYLPNRSRDLEPPPSPKSWVGIFDTEQFLHQSPPIKEKRRNELALSRSNQKPGRKGETGGNVLKQHLAKLGWQQIIIQYGYYIAPRLFINYQGEGSWGLGNKRQKGGEGKRRDRSGEKRRGCNAAEGGQSSWHEQGFEDFEMPHRMDVRLSWQIPLYIQPIMFSQRSYGSYILALVLILGAILAPFVAANFYFSLNNYSCQNTPITHFSIVLTLKQWLNVDSYSIISFFIIAFVSSVVAAWKLIQKTPYRIYTISVSVLAGWRGVWLVVGGVMFWGDLNKRGVCNESISVYMWCTLVIGFVSIPFFCLLGCCYPKIEPVPVQILDFRQPTQRPLRP